MRVGFLTLLFLVSTPSQSAIEDQRSAKKLTPFPVTESVTKILLKNFQTIGKTKKSVNHLRSKVIEMGNKSVPALIEVMKSAKFPDKNRWMATFLLARIMGDKAAPFIAKFTQHPHWVMRLASLKTLSVLKQREYSHFYAERLRDESMIIRVETLALINKLQLKELGPKVWAMLFDKVNYSKTKENKLKRNPIIKSAIRTVGDLHYKPALKPLITMLQKNKYHDIYADLEYAVAKMTGINPPKGSLEVKKVFWQSKSATKIARRNI